MNDVAARSGQLTKQEPLGDVVRLGQGESDVGRTILAEGQDAGPCTGRRSRRSANVRLRALCPRRPRNAANIRYLPDVVGLYMDPPDNAVVLSVDEKTQMQALDPCSSDDRGAWPWLNSVEQTGPQDDAARFCPSRSWVMQK
jgi:hypothetical protein